MVPARIAGAKRNLTGRRPENRKQPAPSESARETPWTDLDWASKHLPVEEFLSFRLMRIASGVQASLSEHYSEDDELTLPEWRTLAALARYSPLSFGRLLALSTYDKSLLSRAMMSLARKGLAVRRTDPRHRRRVICEITDAGRVLYRKVLPEARSRQVALLDLFSPAERTHLYRALKKLQTWLRQDPPPAT